MPAGRRTVRINSLLKEVLSEVIHRDVKDPRLGKFVTVTSVEVTSDLHYAKVFISVLGTQQEKNETIEALESAKGFISVTASKKVVLRYFPSLTFKLDTSIDKHMRIDELLMKIEHEKDKRTPAEPTIEE